MKEYLSIPIIGFNSGKYDLTFIITHMQKYDISPPITKTNSYMKLEYGAYAFLDAHNYVPPTTNLEKFGIMWGVKDIQKDLFPYEWFDSLDKLSETSLPPIECFYNKLKNTLPLEAEYGHAVNIWKEKQFASFGEYMMYYCRCDVELLLHDTANYRSLLMTKNKMELLNYVSVAQISHQNILKNYLKHDLRTIPSQKMYNLISDSIYGGRCEVFKRHAEDSDGVILGLDENNLYGWAMMQKLPYGSMTLHTTTKGICMVLYINLEQRELTKNFPLLAEKVQLDESIQVSGYMDYLRSQLKTKYNKTSLQTEKLMYNLSPKDNYCIYSEALKYLLENNLCCINDIYEVIEQPIDYALKDYVQDMTANRQKAENGIYQGKQTLNDNLVTKSSSEKEFFKLMVNSGFGKMLQSDDKYNKSLLIHLKVDLLYTDTDSIYMQAKVSSYEEFKQRFPGHLQKLHFAATGDITPGKMKLECELKEAMFVKPKTYSYVKKDGKEDVRNKGVVLSQNKEILIFDSYKRAVFSDDLIMAKNTLIRKLICNDTLSMYSHREQQ
ncbi:hypothetical protein PROFUN_15668 [Planoprotostelium fungivorum]|uniref:DNA-directed DNA polymerase n=1 Tax=Planoprotostelium fungivorum TaxID=1890364 RepID=A0A2P6MS71_9EUKA|nr:hypothetical protein PROFUN_15668 [Planoprotostelium fungivorum]